MGSTVKALATGTAGYVLKATASGPAWQAEKDTVYTHPAGGAPSKKLLDSINSAQILLATLLQ